MAKQAQITISASGDVQIEGKNVTGPDCVEFTRAYQNAVGATTADVKKPEFHQQAKAHERANATAGGRRS